MVPLDDSREIAARKERLLAALQQAQEAGLHSPTGVLPDLIAALGRNAPQDVLATELSGFLRIHLGRENDVLGLEGSGRVPVGFAADLYAQSCALLVTVTGDGTGSGNGAGSVARPLAPPPGPLRWLVHVVLACVPARWFKQRR